MEGGGSRKREPCHQLLDLIHKDRFKGNEGNSFEVAEEKKLELRLGPPGEPWFINENQRNTTNTTERDASLPLPLPPPPPPPPPPPMSFGCGYSSKTHNKNNTNWLMNNNSHENQNHSKLSSMEKQQPSSVGGQGGTMFPSFSSPSGFHMKTQQQFQQPNKPKPTSYRQLSSNLNVMSKESSQTCSTKVVMNHTEKKAYFQTSASLPANTAVTNNSSQKRTAPAPVVGWPPIRSFRKNLASNITSSKPSSQSPNGVIPMETSEKLETGRKGLFVKINMDGVPIGRKVDLKAYDSYEKLSCAVDELFSSLLAAQTDSSAAGNDNKMGDVKAITGLLDGSGEYTLVYEDHEGDKMLVGDVPWDMFATTVKRLRVLKSSELSALRGGSSKQAMAPLESAVK